MQKYHVLRQRVVQSLQHRMQENEVCEECDIDAVGYADRCNRETSNNYARSVRLSACLHARVPLLFICFIQRCWPAEALHVCGLKLDLSVEIRPSSQGIFVVSFWCTRRSEIHMVR